MAERLDAQSYADALRDCYMIAMVLTMLPLAEMREMQQRALAIGPLVDPTLYREKGQAASEDARLVDLLAGVQRSILKEMPHFSPGATTSP